MGVDMTDFKLSFRGPRRRSGGRGAKSPLDDIAVQIRDLDEAAQRAARRIDQRARKLRASHKWHPDSGDDMLAELAASLVERADGIRAECDQLSALIERARRVLGETAVEPSAAPEQARKPEPPLEEGWDAARAALEGVPGALAATVLDEDLDAEADGSAWRGPTENGGGESGGPASEGVRLIATQMAIAGSTRPEIQAHLAARFGIEDATPVLDEIFGDSSAEVS